MVSNSSGAASTSTGKSEAVTGGGNAMDEKAMPKDARVMISILKDMGIMEFEPRVVNQLLEFSYRYISTVLEDSKVKLTEKELRWLHFFEKQILLWNKVYILYLKGPLGTC